MRPIQAVSRPGGGPVMVPPPYRDASGRPIQHQSSEMDRATILGALSDMAGYLEQQGVTAHVVAVGGAVNTLYLRSRESTHDIDFFLRNPSAEEHDAIHQAARYANRQRHGQLGGEWFNNATQLLMGRDIQQDLADAAFEQGVVIFDQVAARGGLRMYAAPWSYAFCGKLNRLCEPKARSYDIDDAVVYLRQYLETNRLQTVSARRVKRWCQQYKKQVTDAVLQQVDEAFYRMYGQRVIDWQSRA